MRLKRNCWVHLWLEMQLLRISWVGRDLQGSSPAHDSTWGNLRGKPVSQSQFCIERMRNKEQCITLLTFFQHIFNNILEVNIMIFLSVELSLLPRAPPLLPRVLRFGIAKLATRARLMVVGQCVRWWPKGFRELWEQQKSVRTWSFEYPARLSTIKLVRIPYFHQNSPCAIRSSVSPCAGSFASCYSFPYR